MCEAMCAAPQLGGNPSASATPAEEYPIVPILPQTQIGLLCESNPPSPVVRVLRVVVITIWDYERLHTRPTRQQGVQNKSLVIASG